MRCICERSEVRCATETSFLGVEVSLEGKQQDGSGAGKEWPPGMEVGTKWKAEQIGLKGEGDSGGSADEGSHIRTESICRLTCCEFNSCGSHHPLCTPFSDWAVSFILKGELRFASWHFLDFVLQLIKQALTTWEPRSRVPSSSRVTP